MDTEFEIGEIVNVDRYNHIDDIQVGKIVGYGKMPTSDSLIYHIDINGIVIQTTGISIVQSKRYQPVDDKDRHDKIPFNHKR